MRTYINVNSTNLSQVGYDPDTKMMDVTFQSGLTYRYFEVEQILFERLAIAPSKGQYFNTWVKGQYKYERLGKV